jgi:hypothetical protein
MKRKLIVPALLLALTTGLSAQGNCGGINLSLWKNISTQRFDTASVTRVNLGVVSVMGNLNGVGVNVIGSAVHGDMNGLQLSGLANLVKDGMHGVQLSAIANVNGNDAAGISASGLMNICGNRFSGVMTSGFMNITGDKATGMIIGGLMNIAGQSYRGLTLSGIANIAGDSYGGITASGLLNVVGGDVNGVQVAALCNIAADSLRGVQIGMLNYATNGRGLQLGLFNYRRESFKGIQLGLVNANPQTRVQMMAFLGTATKLNLAARFRNRLFYTILGGGAYYLDLNDKFSASLFYRCGMWHKLYKDLSISGDLGYQHIATFANHRHMDVPRSLYALQGRINLEYQLTEKLALMVTGGYGGSRYYNKNRTYDKGAIVEAGVVLF